MREMYWTKPVRVEAAGRFRVISSTRGAAQWLLYQWPTVGGPEHRAARVACIAVLKNEQPPDNAREAGATLRPRSSGAPPFDTTGWRPNGSTRNIAGRRAAHNSLAA
jgi:hypothetical protein